MADKLVSFRSQHLSPRIETPDGDVFRLGVAVADCRKGDLVYVQIKGNTKLTKETLVMLGLCDMDGKLNIKEIVHGGEKEKD